MTSLCMLSAEVSVRQAMVQLGCTRLLVQVAMSKARYDIYHCCAMALGHLSNDMANTHQMVLEQAVPALLHLAKIDNDVVHFFFFSFCGQVVDGCVDTGRVLVGARQPIA